MTDAFILVTAVPSKRRNLLQLTAKSTHFGRKTFTSWLIESAGTVPIQRRMDFPDGRADNTNVMLKLIEALEYGDAICLFPEGISRYHPAIAPLKTGVARLVSDVLSRNSHKPDFEVAVLTCSITYMHRQHFRSDVLVTFNPPMKFTPKNNPELLSPVEYANIRALTAQMHQQISSGTLDAPSWRLIRNAKLAARIYAPLGTTMRLGDYVRVVRTFLEAFKLAEQPGSESTSDEKLAKREGASRADTEMRRLGDDLKVYQDMLTCWGIKDDRVRAPLPAHIIIYRIFVRFGWAAFLFTISIPGLLLWLPVFIATSVAVSRFKRTGPVWDTWNKIAHYKLIYGLVSGVCVWGISVLLTLSFAPITAALVPGLMWMALRWIEDAISALRAFVALLRLLRAGQSRFAQLHAMRTGLHKRVTELAVHTLGLPPDPERYFPESGGEEKGRVKGRWASRTAYFSVRRRRKRDWNETLRLYDQVDYPEEE
ncbi:uncharacterized protein FIBRA_07538 [Fibroporia radiculosa]|uniref:Phospholipid/glycerol acyltransferase domain-containing protein n=1 Tax=Fibroporia radiculosa TaxID=599839 RepID=J4H4P0_9APHY|nr:uncharacterized protein FIBRA_07538 [Fibroporia radiculosa]CCM05324.1 predicted protein [Fibroporia radiculosa]